ncbi:MAG: hypothetical protein HKN82_14425 [Akkermansiaceae bacterium]|nr:hypothetical protein [Akkermansiaceae bacterium]
MNTLRLVMAACPLLAGSAAADLAKLEVPIGPRGATGTLYLYVFDAREVSMQIIDQGGLDAQAHEHLGAAMVAHGCVAGATGGHFDPKGTPLGLVVADGKKIGAPSGKGEMTEGVLVQDGERLRILRAPSFFGNGASQARNLVQAGPFLVENGKAVTGLSSRKHARRTFIVTDGGHRWALGYAPPTSLAALAKILADAERFTPFKVHAALSLGDGSSAALWVKSENHPFYLHEVDPVRNFVGLVQR